MKGRDLDLKKVIINIVLILTFASLIFYSNSDILKLIYKMEIFS